MVGLQVDCVYLLLQKGLVFVIIGFIVEFGKWDIRNVKLVGN